jgi:hypothetical protein
VNAISHSSSELLGALLRGPMQKGVVLGDRLLLFGAYAVVLTSPPEPRMPNGIECRLTVARPAGVAIGGGRLRAGGVDVWPGPEWDPRPVFDRLDALSPGPEPGPAGGAWLPGDAGYDAVLAGYLAGLVLLHGQRRRAEDIAARRSEGSSRLAAAMLRHAARGEVPEPVHGLLATRDTQRLATSWPAGIGWLRGLLSAGLPLEPATRQIATATPTPLLGHLRRPA